MFGVVIIGRNEGERLRRCLEALRGRCCVYVDSGSTDGSVELAESLGVHVVALDLSIPFTAARARNEGFDALLQQDPSLRYAMFVDGDCEVREEWFDPAVLALEDDPSLAVVCGRRRERYPERSIYNRMCDIEWDTPIGEVAACGGDAIYRVSAFQTVGGFDPSFIAGEEPELCFRLRDSGFTVRRLDAEMTWHDAAMTSVKQWWRRSERSGHAYFLGWAKHGQTPERFRFKEVRSICAWFALLVVVPLIALCFLNPVIMLGFMVLLALQVLRIALNEAKRPLPLVTALQYSFFIVLGKLPQGMGIWRAYWRKRRGKVATLVEYK